MFALERTWHKNMEAECGTGRCGGSVRKFLVVDRNLTKHAAAA